MIPEMGAFRYVTDASQSRADLIFAIKFEINLNFRNVTFDLAWIFHDNLYLQLVQYPIGSIGSVLPTRSVDNPLSYPILSYGLAWKELQKAKWVLG